MMPFILWGWVMQDFKLVTRQLLEIYLGSDMLSDVAEYNGWASPSNTEK